MAVLVGKVYRFLLSLFTYKTENSVYFQTHSLHCFQRIAMEQGDRSYSQAESEVVNGAGAVPARVIRRSSSRRRRNGWPRRDPRRKAAYATYDHNSIGYEWLQPGWIAEEYTTKSGRTYKVNCAL